MNKSRIFNYSFKIFDLLITASVYNTLDNETEKNSRFFIDIRIVSHFGQRKQQKCEKLLKCKRGERTSNEKIVKCSAQNKKH